MKEEHIKELQKTIGGLTVDNNSLRKTLKYRLRDIDITQAEITELKNYISKLENDNVGLKDDREDFNIQLDKAKDTIARRNMQIANLKAKKKPFLYSHKVMTYLMNNALVNIETREKLDTMDKLAIKTAKEFLNR